MLGTHHPHYQNSDNASFNNDDSIPCDSSNSMRSSGDETNHPNGSKRGSTKPRSSAPKDPEPPKRVSRPKTVDLQARLPIDPSDLESVEASTLEDARSEEEFLSNNQAPDNDQLAALGLTEGDLSSNGNLDSNVSHDDAGLAQARQVWRSALSELALSMPPATYHTWMRETHVVGYEDGEFIIGVPNAYACDWIKNRLRTQIKRTLSRLQQRSIQVNFRVTASPIQDESFGSSDSLYSAEVHASATSSQESDFSNDVASGPSSQDEPSISEDLSVANSGTNGSGAYLAGADSSDDFSRVNGHQSHDSSENDVPSNVLVSHREINGNHDNIQYGKNVSIKLNAYHTFDTFVVGNHNRMAHAAAEAISDKPGASFNPLFIYGGVGLGKTHLLHAIGNKALRKGFHVLYCTSEQFTNELILAIRSQSTELFRNKYRQVDILLIDDIQFIAGKESTQEEFFHTFNHLHAAGRQVILSSDRPPKSLPTLEERLRSRFEGGLQTDISKPDFETRVAILQSKAHTIGMVVESAALMLIAERVDSNVRELEGALNRIALQAKLFSNKLDVALTESVLKNLAPERTLRTPSAIIEIVAEHYHLTVEDLESRSRTKEIAHARQVAMYLLREENAISLPSIGDHLGGRDHSTIRHGVDKVIQDIESDESVRHQIMTLREKIYAAPGF